MEVVFVLIMWAALWALLQLIRYYDYKALPQPEPQLKPQSYKEENEFDFVFITRAGRYNDGFDPLIVNPTVPTRCLGKTEFNKDEILLSLEPLGERLTVRAPEDVDGFGIARDGVLIYWEYCPLRTDEAIYLEKGKTVL